MTSHRKLSFLSKKLKLSLSMALWISCSFYGTASAQNDDKSSSAIPDKVTDLDGMVIDYEHYKEYVTTGRPWDNDKMYLLYNVGTGQFLNVGGYWGTHAALSDVPRPFWLQRRNEKKVSGQWSYKRYPESLEENKGLFINDFFNLTSLQVGSVERSSKTKAPHVTYNYVRYVSNDGNTVKNIFEDNYTIDGDNNVMETIYDIYADNGYLEAEINMSKCQGTSSENMENLISFGENIAHWDITENGTKVKQNNLFIYGFKDGSGFHLRVQPVDSLYNDATHKSGGTENPITVGSDGIVKILIKRNHVIVNDVECLPRNTANYESPIKSFINSLTELQVGSTQGNQQSFATYNYVTLTKTSIYDNDPTHVIRPNVACNGREFIKTFSGSLGDQTINANIDLSTCNPDGNNNAENILSIGTDIANWYTENVATSNNIHIYYDGCTLEADAVNNVYPGKPNKYYQWTKALTSAARAASGTNISVKLNKLGFFINGELVFGPENEIVAYLLGNASEIQVGSKQGDNRSYATYENVELTASSENVVTPGYVGDGKTKFGESYTGNLQDKEIVADLDLTKCTTDNENILSIGTDITDWGYNKGYTSYNVHFYYPAATQGDSKAQYIQVDPAASGNKYRYYIKIGTDRKIRIVLNSKGLFMNGVRYDNIYSDGSTLMTSDIMKYLLNDAKEIQVGSKQGDTRSHATYNHLTVKEYVADTDPNVITPGTACEGVKFGKTFDGTLADKTITAVINLTNCQKGKNENILSIGNNISEWGRGSNKSVSDAANLHFYYNANNSYATYQFVSEKKGAESNPSNIAIGDDKKLTITWKDGVLTANGTTIADPLGVLSQLSTSATEIQVGSHEGDNRSHATYEKLTVETTESASSAKAHEPAKATSRAAKASESQADVTYIYKDKVGDGTKFPSDLTQKYDINFANGDYIEANIDLSTCKEKYENILSIGDAIDKWGQGDATNAHNLHIYLLNNDGTTYNLYVVYVNKDHSNDLKRAFSVTKDSDGKAIMHLKLSKAGLFINDKNMYPDTDPMPTIGYDPKKAGDIVRFKFTEDKIPVLDEQGKYIIDDSGSGIYVSNNGYIYTTESRTDKTMPLFISSRFKQEQTASNNEDAYFAWAPYIESNKKWGTIGVFADRSLPQNSSESTTAQSIAYSQWYFEPVTGYTNPTYKIYLKMKDTRIHERKAKDTIEYPSKSGNFYLQATTNHIYGNHLENYFGGYGDESDGNSLLTSVDALNELPAKAENAYWRLFNIAEYYKLFGAANSELNSMLDLSFSLRDPDFTRESYELSNWKMEDGLTDKVRIGYDQYSKKTTEESNYSDDDKKYDIQKNGEYIQEGNAQYKRMKNLLNNHARYMGVDVRKGGYGKFYQDTELRFAGWYAITCGGLSNVGAKLFVQINGSSSTIEQPLHVLTDEERTFFNKPSAKYPNSTDCTQSMWPFDEYDDAGNMPMYNALVAINDKQVENGELVDKYKTQVAFYIDPSLVGSTQNADGTTTTKTVKVRFGIDIPQQGDTSGAKPQGSQRTTSASAVAEADQWTVFDNFHLQFGGKSIEPNLILDEDNTTLDYLDRTIHTFDSRPMHLHRTFQADKWNTLVLPVSLTKEQFTNMLGEDAKLAKLEKIEDTSLIFQTETENATTGEYLRAYQPYIVKPQKAEGDHDAYTATLYNKADGGKTSVDITSPANHFYVADVTLEPETKDNDTGVREYDFAHSEKCNYKVSDDLTWAYVMKDSHTATEEGNKSRQANIYGTLCKTYTTGDDGKNTMIAGRPTLQDGKSYYMKDNSTIQRRGTKNPYGLKGFRCWFTYTEGTETQGAKPFTISIDGVDDPTGIDNLQRADGITVVDKYADAIYNLGGQKIATTDQIRQLPAGIYIVNGKKYIVNK